MTARSRRLLQNLLTRLFVYLSNPDILAAAGDAGRRFAG